ncbi:hypothetical protein K490DRAFT_63068 [Saccharata proteae CBS 121410]|uniref:LisH domain-containing protein n=1 Tax=Saccharata proteae CBS 121410 TaxID=1314787 RepID=A0A9P4I0Y3_9PEZI|nr:hypothetical protein K490DRAFT_63068 [Saccharata proteae CBS 121410]
MTTETLSSNVVNYLVWRYLQEAGYGRAALALAHDWNDDPENLPFAPKIETHTLLHMLQDGLWFDEIRASTSNGTQERRYRFGPDHGRPFARYNGGAQRRKSSAGHRDRKRAVNGNTVDGLAPHPKRKKKSNGVAPQVNGDAIDNDMNGVVHLPQVESEAIMSDVESPPEEEIIPLVTTLSLGESNALQTEKLAELGPSTMYLRVDDPGANAIHTEWSPTEPQLLLTAGESLLRMYLIPSTLTSEQQTPAPIFKDIDAGLHRYTVTALSWTSPGEAVIGTQEAITAETGETMSKGKIVHLTSNELQGGLQSRLITTILGSVFALRYNASTRLLLSVSSTDVDSSISIYNEFSHDPLHTAQADHPIFAAEWMSDSFFVVAGYSILDIYKIDAERGLSIHKSYRTDVSWEQLRYDPVCDIIACSSAVEPQLGLILPGDDEIRRESFEGEDITGLEFQPMTNKGLHDDSTPRLLATSSDAGFWTIQFWNAKKPFERLQRFASGSVVEISFSPDGFLLAAAGTDTVTFWDPEAGRAKAKWKPSEDSKDRWDSSLPAGQETELDHKLRWDSDGKKLAYKLGNQIAIINFQR